MNSSWKCETPSFANSFMNSSWISSDAKTPSFANSCGMLTMLEHSKFSEGMSVPLLISIFARKVKEIGTCCIHTP